MIVPMTKYNIVLFAQQKEDFLNKLQDLGLMDITITSWEPNDDQRELILSIERHNTAISRLKELAKDENFVPGEPYSNGSEAYEKYLEASHNLDTLNAEIAQAEKDAAELKAWGTFNPEYLEQLRESGVILHFFSVYTHEYEANIVEWTEKYNIQSISEEGGITYFVAITGPDEEVAINAQEIKVPSTTAQEKEAEILKLNKEREPWLKQMARAAASIDMIAEHGDTEKERLQLSQAAASAQEEAEGSLVIMEGWTPSEDSAKVEKMLDEYPNVFYIKSRPTPEDNTPTLLKNGKRMRMFEIIGRFYSQPKYGTMDLTRWFGPFYALFFGLCLADAGYGLIYFITGLVMRAKLPKMRDLANLITVLGASTIVCGVLMDSFFGVKLTGWAPLAGLKNYLISDHMFYIALAIGVVQILFAMILKIVLYTRRFGFKYALATLGWFLMLLTLLPTLADVLDISVPESVLAWSPVKLVILIIGTLLMLFMNKPGRNPFINFGSGLWDLYNNIVGFISDFLSYIRLFAIGLSGGILATVFNDLAVGLSSSIGVPVVQQIFLIVILLFGHSLTIFMSSISAFVHPMRLTFVEFYKNAGFEDTQREFTPLKRNRKIDNQNKSN